MLGFRRKRWRTVVGGSRRTCEALLERSGGEAPPRHAGSRGRARRRRRERPHRRRRGAPLRRASSSPSTATRRCRCSPTRRRRAARARRVPVDGERDGAAHRRARAPSRAAARPRGTTGSPTARSANGHPTITYYLNRLQRLETDEHYCVTLNRTARSTSRAVIRRIATSTRSTRSSRCAPRRELPALNRGRTAFAGAWQGVGFHEDGLASGLRAAAAFGVEW